MEQSFTTQKTDAMEEVMMLQDVAAFLKSRLEPWEIQQGWDSIGKRMGLSCELEGKIRDLLNEFGEDNGLEEDWYLEYGDIEGFFEDIES